MLISTIQELLFKLGQEQLSIGLERLSYSELERFALQLQKYTPALSVLQKKLALHPAKPFSKEAKPYPRAAFKGNRELGEALLRQGKVGCMILAGGQGTRLGFDGPKGSFPVSPIKGKSLFQLFCERTKAASLWSGHALPLCIVTSALNHDQTVKYFQDNAFFGLSPAQVFFLTQEMLPLLDNRGHWMLESPGKIAEGPDGNGHALRLFFTSGLWEKWKRAGIEHLNVIFVDNALADPFDAEFTGFASYVDAALKAVERLSPDEKMGVLAECNGKLKVIEYTELSASGQFPLSSTGMFCFSMQFIAHLFQELNVELPLHLARKKAPILLGTSKGFVQEEAQVWKCERFIFDFLDHAQTSAVLVCPREKIYAPLKNASGDKSAETVKQALLLHDREVYRALTGILPPEAPFELDPAFYYPKEGMREQLLSSRLSDQDYVSSV